MNVVYATRKFHRNIQQMNFNKKLIFCQILKSKHFWTFVLTFIYTKFSCVLDLRFPNTWPLRQGNERRFNVLHEPGPQGIQRDITRACRVD